MYAAGKSIWRTWAPLFLTAENGSEKAADCAM
jgi:hypothetical protein